MIAPSFRRVCLFVDWNCQLLAAPDHLKGSPVEQCRFALRRVGKRACKTLMSFGRSPIYRVRIRLYHGWTAGITQTTNRRAFNSIDEFNNPDTIFSSTRVLALADVEFGDRLINAMPRRENAGIHIHLPNTYRRQRSDAPPAEKMVDTALAADLLCWAKEQPDSIALVVSDDDDIVPPVFVAESWMVPSGGEVRLLRSAARGESRFLKLEGLLIDE